MMSTRVFWELMVYDPTISAHKKVKDIMLASMKQPNLNTHTAQCQRKTWIVSLEK